MPRTNLKARQMQIKRMPPVKGGFANSIANSKAALFPGWGPVWFGGFEKGDRV